jgi:hypothetical protein
MSYVNGFSFDSDDYLIKSEENKIVNGTAVFNKISGDNAIYNISEDLYNHLSEDTIIIFDSVEAAKEKIKKLVFQVIFSETGITQQFNVYTTIGEYLTTDDISKYSYYKFKIIDNNITKIDKYKMTTRYVTMADIEELSIKKNDNGALAGLANYVMEIPYGVIGFASQVSEWYELDREN